MEKPQKYARLIGSNKHVQFQETLKHISTERSMTWFFKQVLRELQLIKEKLKNWDETFLANNGRLANNNEYMSDSDFTALTNKKIALKLLESWNITVHLS